MNLDNIGVSTVKDSTAFKKIQFFSKTNPTNLFSVKSDFQNSFNKVNSFYKNDLDLNNSYTYGMDRQHNYTSLNSTLPMFSTLIDNNSIDKFFSYNLNTKNNNIGSTSLNRLAYNTNNSELESTITNFNKLLPLYFKRLNGLDFSVFLNLPNTFSVLSAENDSKQYSNPLKYSLNLKHKKKTIQNFDNLLNTYVNNEDTLTSLNPSSNFSSTNYNTESNLKFKDFKSSNAQFLGSERTVRLLNNLNSNSFKWNSLASPNLTTSLSNNLTQYGNTQNLLYSSSLSN
jgi:hypothetical protein